jgi:hypothetical protein
MTNHPAATLLRISGWAAVPEEGQSNCDSRSAVGDIQHHVVIPVQTLRSQESAF